jgi:hypothetical protein
MKERLKLSTVSINQNGADVRLSDHGSLTTESATAALLTEPSISVVFA